MIKTHETIPTTKPTNNPNIVTPSISTVPTCEASQIVAIPLISNDKSQQILQQQPQLQMQQQQPITPRKRPRKQSNNNPNMLDEDPAKAATFMTEMNEIFQSVIRFVFILFTFNSILALENRNFL